MEKSRVDLIASIDELINEVCRKITVLDDQERSHLQKISVSYRQLVKVIRDYYSEVDSEKYDYLLWFFKAANIHLFEDTRKALSKQFEEETGSQIPDEEGL